MLTEFRYTSKVHSNPKHDLLINEKEKIGIQYITKSKGINWLFTKNRLCLWKFRRLKPNKERKNGNSVWWLGCRYGTW